MTLVAFTFDDGPSEWTPPLLEVLDEHDARATFFVLGERIMGRENILRAIGHCGHEIGVHGWTHDRVSTLHQGVFVNHLRMTADVVEDLTGRRPTLWRPPWHDADTFRIARARAVGFRVMGVDVDAHDTVADVDADTILHRIQDELVTGIVVGLHDGVAGNSSNGASRKPTIEAVDRLLAAVDVQSVTISTLLGW